MVLPPLHPALPGLSFSRRASSVKPPCASSLCSGLACVALTTSCASRLERAPASCVVSPWSYHFPAPIVHEPAICLQIVLYESADDVCEL